VAPAGREEFPVTKMLIDCDPGHDDAIAILFAARRCELVGITTTHGNASLENTTRNALAICTLAGLDVPVAQGCDAPLVGAATHAGDIHGRTGLDGADLPVPDRGPIATHAVDFIIEQAERHKGELVLAVVGPQTNVALALRREPRLASWLKAITIMGGSTTIGNITPAAEFNIYADPEAAAAVFACGAPIWMVGYNVTRQTGFTQPEIDRLRAGGGGRTAAVIADLMQFYLDGQKRVFGLDIAPMHDVCAVFPFVRPDLLTFVEAAVEVELAGRLTRGMTVCDLRNKRAGGTGAIQEARRPNARVAVASDARPLIAEVIDVVLACP
jgi:inosine-uridine nucleoside N-ribohydrolase